MNILGEAQLLLTVVDEDVLELAVVAEHPLVVFAAEAGGLVAAEGRTGGVVVVAAHRPWRLADSAEFAHLPNTPELTGTLERPVAVARAIDAAKDALAGICRPELLVRLTQTQARQLLCHDYARHLGTHRFAAAVQHIR